MEDENQVKARALVERLLSVPEQAAEFIDDNVSSALPPGSTIVEFGPHGTAYWTKTLEIKAIQASGTPLKYFLKVNHTHAGGQVLEGEFASLEAIHRLLPDFVPKPIAQGSYASDPDVHFLLMEFLDLRGDVPDVDSLPAKLAEMHLKGTSPNGKFGFHLHTGPAFLQGKYGQSITWSSSWEALFTSMYIPVFHWEQSMHGKDDEMQTLFKSMIEKVIPRLLRPLETGKNKIRPCLLHGDLWDGNTGTDASTESPLIFDPASFYGHNEYDLAPWNLPRHKIYRPYIREYQRHFERADPKEDYEDRLLLYRQ
ncbi:hypothetical protein BP6252_13921 [Coleophoma cylindrospora]|uniref:protein-ribulosamine 3-kinase n=1 Tax=Coleophoma cylindrospora TaxID=1849047 RepID=A0A3D8Q5B9_9HELO|nr:hypothetical protein BP6252_13921 [Coleophoma cylindrospora]